MSKNKTKSKQNIEGNNNLVSLKWLLTIPSLLLTFFICFFIHDFPEYIGTEESWLNTAQILNGFLTPILTLASIMLIYFTWTTTKTDLEETKKYLKYQEEREQLQIFSRRVSKLNEKFDTKIDFNIKVGAGMELTNFLEKKATFIHQQFAVWATENSNENSNGNMTNSKNNRNRLIMDYIANKDFFVPVAAHKYAVTCSPNEKPDFDKAINSNNKTEILYLFLGWELYKNRSFGIILSSLRRLLNGLKEISDENLNGYFEELALNFDLKFLKAYIDRLEPNELDEKVKDKFNKFIKNTPKDNDS